MQWARQCARLSGLLRDRRFNGASVVGAASAAMPPASRLPTLQTTVRGRQNVFAALMGAIKTHGLGQIGHALYDVGGEYRHLPGSNGGVQRSRNLPHAQ